jgi:hypothetical protein
MGFQVEQDRPRQCPVCGGIELFVQGAAPSSILAIDAALRMARVEGKNGAMPAQLWNLLMA